MEAHTDLQTYLEQGRSELAQGHGREAAIAYAHGAQLDPHDPAVHLGLAEANLALGNYGVVQTACRKVQELQPQGADAQTAQALLDLLDRRYERALQCIDAVIADDPSIAYAHALRSYLLRANGQDYDANLARARATRLSYGGRFEHCFPELEKPNTTGYAYTGTPTANERPAEKQNGNRRQEEPNWSRPTPLRRNMIRTNFFLNQNPGFVTNVIIAISAVLFLLGLLNQNIFIWGAQINIAIRQGEIWRLFTGIFLYPPDLQNALLPTLISLLSLFFVGRAVEIFYGQGRYVLLYVLSGIAGGIISLLLLPPISLGLGPSGAIFGIFGAIGVFYIANRRALGAYSMSAIGSWGFWLLLNLAFSFSSGITYFLVDVLTLATSMLIAYFLLPHNRGGRTRV